MLKVIASSVFIVTLSGCTTVQTPEDHLAEVIALNDIEVCYQAHYGPRPGLVNPIAYMALKTTLEEHKATRKAVASGVVADRGIACDLSTLAILHEMRVQSAIMMIPSPSPSPSYAPAGDGTQSQSRQNSRDIMRCGQQGKGVDFVTGNCM